LIYLGSILPMNSTENTRNQDVTKYIGRLDPHGVTVLKNGNPLPLYNDVEPFSSTFCWGVRSGVTPAEQCNDKMGNYQLALALLADTTGEETAVEECIRFANSICFTMKHGTEWQLTNQDIQKIRHELIQGEGK